jgi:hypothetical protein
MGASIEDIRTSGITVSSPKLILKRMYDEGFIEDPFSASSWNAIQDGSTRCGAIAMQEIYKINSETVRRGSVPAGAGQDATLR